MNLIQFNSYKTPAVIILVLVLLLINYCDYLFKSYENFYQRLNGSEALATLAPNAGNYETATSKRIKRFLIFQGSGIIKFIFGTSFQIIMADKKRSMSQFYNFQMQYAPPNNPVYWWSIYNTTTFAARTNSLKRSADMLMSHDKSRSLIYEFMETILERSGNIGRECLLKIICELARAPLIENSSTGQLYANANDERENVDIYHKIINAIFTPLYPNVDESYLNARAAGQNGANCYETFGGCLFIEKFLKRFTQFI